VNRKVLSYRLNQLRKYKDGQYQYYTTANAFQPTIYDTGSLDASINEEGEVDF
jgi:hypothetical protein